MIFRLIFSFLILTFSVSTQACLAQDDGYLEVDKVIASVNGDPLTMHDLKEKVSPAMARMKQSKKGPEQQTKLLQIGMQELMIEKVLTKEATASNIKVSEKEIAAYIGEIKRQNGVDDPGFTKILASRGMTLEQYKKDVKMDILRGRVIGKHIKKDIPVSEDEIDSFIEKEVPKLPENGTVRVHLLSFSIDDYPGLGKEGVEALAEEVRAKILKGMPFRSASPKNFQDLGYIKRSDMRKELLELVNNYSYEEIGQVKRLDNSYILLKIAGAVDDQGRPDRSFRNRVKQVIHRRKYEQEVSRFLKEELPKKHHIETML